MLVIVREEKQVLLTWLPDSVGNGDPAQPVNSASRLCVESIHRSMLDSLCALEIPNWKIREHWEELPISPSTFPSCSCKMVLAPQGTITTRHREQEGWVSVNSQDCNLKDMDHAFVPKDLRQVTSPDPGVTRKRDIAVPAWGQVCHLPWLELLPGGQEEKPGLQLAQRDTPGSTELPQWQNTPPLPPQMGNHWIIEWFVKKRH